MTGVTFEVESTQRNGDETIVELEGKKVGPAPLFIVKNRARVKAVRVVGIENLPRAAAERTLDGDFGRFTEILDFATMGQGPVEQDVSIAVAVQTGE